MTTTLRGVPRPGAAERVFIARSLRHSLRAVDALLMAILLPTMLMFLFTFVFGGALDGSGGYVDYVVPGIILTCAGFGASYTAVSVNTDMTGGLIERIRTMPIGGTAVLTGHIVASVMKNLLATGIVIGLAVAIGFRPSANLPAWLAALALVTLWILAITCVFAALGLAARSPDAAFGFGFILLFLPYLSSAFVPLSTLPDWLRPIAEHQPVTPVIETIRGLLMGGADAATSAVAVAWCAGFIAVALLWAAWLYRRATERR
ncbi:ABC transporter permease [Salinibacterium sp. ZJ77]|uniref:ABC transporter permease n=1 Tax=Salinibacterium sp. ZJ77 TaxID=2708337 RepID=UPI0014231FF8|nr:ABC transporter permease [Salinibacterium sp. ZJ77]